MFLYFKINLKFCSGEKASNVRWDLFYRFAFQKQVLSARIVLPRSLSSPILDSLCLVCRFSSKSGSDSSNSSSGDSSSSSDEDDDGDVKDGKTQNSDAKTTPTAKDDEKVETETATSAKIEPEIVKLEVPDSVPGKAEVVSEEKKTKKGSEDDLIEMEDNDDYLMYLEDILKTIHKAYYELYDQVS